MKDRALINAKSCAHVQTSKPTIAYGALCSINSRVNLLNFYRRMSFCWSDAICTAPKCITYKGTTSR